MPECAQDMQKYAYRVVGPILYRYARWIVHEAHARGIKTLWFLARDGYLLRIIADKICKNEGIDIESRYLFCSRRSLRMPMYHLVGEEAYEYLFSWGYYCTPRTLLARAEICGSEADSLLNSLGYNLPDELLSREGFDNLCESLREDGGFLARVMEKSRSEYPLALEYLSREGMLDADTVAIADSGWTGSMQHALRIILESSGYKGHIVGFYFGMYADVRDGRDGEMLTYYFNSRGPIFHKVMFNNNLFECMLSAPHPMTVCYRRDGDSVTPVFAGAYGDKMKRLVDAQIDGVVAYVDDKIFNSGTKCKAELISKQYYNIIKRAMIYPTAQEARMYSHFLFCDDVSESYALPLARLGTGGELRECLLPVRIMRKILGKRRSTPAPLWIYGAIADMPNVIRSWYRINALTYDFLKALNENRKSRIKVMRNEKTRKARLRENKN